MLYFKSRKLARAFAAKNETRHNKDMGSNAPDGKRWAVKVL